MAPDCFPANTLSVQKFERWLKEVNKQPVNPIHLVHHLHREFTIKPAITSQLSDH